MISADNLSRLSRKLQNYRVKYQAGVRPTLIPGLFLHNAIKRIYFKGGTALRIGLWQARVFSEDLDFAQHDMILMRLKKPCCKP